MGAGEQRLTVGGSPAGERQCTLPENVGPLTGSPRVAESWAGRECQESSRRRIPAIAKKPTPTVPNRAGNAGRKPPSGVKGDSAGERVVSENRRARHDYDILDTLECGIALVGSEVKSLRSGRISLEEAYGRVEKGEVWLHGCDIPEYEKANQLNHVPKRPRKLLLHRREIGKFAGHAFEKGLTLVPLRVYFKGGRVKVLLGIGRGRQAHDKRQSLKARDAKREIDAAVRGRSSGRRR